MTGDLILNLSRTTQSSELIDCGQVKKIDSLRDTHHQHHQQSKNSRRSLSKIAQRMSGGGVSNELTGGVSMQRAPHARYDSSPSSPTNDSTEIDEEIEHDDDEAARNCSCASPNYVDDAPAVEAAAKCCSAGDKCINYWNNQAAAHHHQQQQHSYNNRDTVDHHRVQSQNDARHQNNSHSDKSSRLGTMTNNSQNSSTGSSSTTSGARSGSSDERLLGSNRPLNGLAGRSSVNGTSSSSNSGNGCSELIMSDDVCYSVPSSPTTTTPCVATKSSANSVPTSPETGAVTSGGEAAVVMRRHAPGSGGGNSAMNGMMRTCDPNGFRTSRSEDHLQLSQRDGSGMGMVPIDIDEDVNSSLNTLLDTRHDSDDSPNASSGGGGGQDRIVWTYNAPIKPGQQQQQQHHHHMYSHSSSMSSSPQHTDTPVSPTSVSSSVMSSNSSSKSLGSANYVAQQSQHNQQHQQQQQHNQTNQNLGTSRSGNTNNAMTDSGNMTTCPDLSMSEAVSNISSPDYQDDNLLLSSRDMAGGMAVSDPSDSDSTLMMSDAVGRMYDRENKVVIHVKRDGDGQQMRSAVPQHLMGAGIHNQGYSELRDSEDELATLTDDNTPTLMMGGGGGMGLDRDASPVSDDGSDVESLHSYHYSPKAVDMPSAIRLAKRLYGLDGFKKSDVSRHLSKK